jgi:hypothetical protein
VTDSATTSTPSVAVPGPRQPVHDGVIEAVIVAPPLSPPVPAWPYPAPVLPPPPRRSPLWPILTALLVVCMLLALGGATAAVITLRGDSVPTDAVTNWVDMRPDSRDAALRALLGRLEGAIKAKDKAAFMAEVDQSDPTLVKREQLLYDNLTKIPFADFHYELGPWRSDLQRFLSAQVRQKYHQAAHVGTVTIRYRIAGIDSKMVTAPWLPIFVYNEGRWEIGGQASDKNAPYGANGQPWDAAGPIVVQRSKRVVAVLSADDTSRGPYLLDLAEQGLDRLARTRPNGWDGKVFVTAVQDTRIFDTYFADSPERVARVAAIAVPYYAEVPDWANFEPDYAATRIVFNPQELSAQPDELAHDLTHEFTHAAMGPVTSGATPRWLVEGFAEYAAYNGADLPKSFLQRDLGGLDVSKGLPSDDDFYSESRNYVGAWLACRYIATQYGQDKLIALYAAFVRETSPDIAVKQVLGIDLSSLESAWQHYVKGLEG